MKSKEVDLTALRACAENAIAIEASALTALAKAIGDDFDKALLAILYCTGKVVITGMGKSGHVGVKMAATFASTGTPAIYVHPGEASHGDLGMIEKYDVVIAISKSGESAELADVISYCRRFGICVIAITAEPKSSLGAAASHLLLLPKLPEACPMGLAPTTSTTMTMALGDALAVACIKAREFAPENFQVFHPGGKLGQKLTRVRDIMHPVDRLPLLLLESTVSQAALEMSRCRFGCVGIIDNQGYLVGIFTDGDLRRHFSAENLGRQMKELMTPNPQQLAASGLIADVLHLFAEKRIPSAFVCVDRKPVGLIHVHDLFQRGFV